MSMEARVEALCIKNRRTKFPRSGVLAVDVSLEGFIGDVHSGFTRPSDARDRDLPRGTQMRNYRQWSAVSIEELAQIAEKLGIERIEPWMVSANLTFSGIPDLTKLPRGTRLEFRDGPILMVEGENSPCVLPGKEIAAVNAGVDPASFVKAALHRRGVVGVVHLPGAIRVGDVASVRLPPTGK